MRIVFYGFSQSDFIFEAEILTDNVREISGEGNRISLRQPRRVSAPKWSSQSFTFHPDRGVWWAGAATSKIALSVLLAPTHSAGGRSRTYAGIFLLREVSLYRPGKGLRPSPSNSYSRIVFSWRVQELALRLRPSSCG